MKAVVEASEDIGDALKHARTPMDSKKGPLMAQAEILVRIIPSKSSTQAHKQHRYTMRLKSQLQ